MVSLWITFVLCVDATGRFLWKQWIRRGGFPPLRIQHGGQCSVIAWRSNTPASHRDRRQAGLLRQGLTDT